MGHTSSNLEDTSAERKMTNQLKSFQRQTTLLGDVETILMIFWQRMNLPSNIVQNVCLS